MRIPYEDEESDIEAIRRRAPEPAFIPAWKPNPVPQFTAPTVKHRPIGWWWLAVLVPLGVLAGCWLAEALK